MQQDKEESLKDIRKQIKDIDSDIEDQRDEFRKINLKGN